MTTATAVEARLTRLWETPKTVYGWFATVDHKELGIRYLVTAFVFLIIGGLEALLMHLQLAHSDVALLSPEAYNQIFAMHGATMIFWYAAPILSGFAVYLVPLMIGARDMAFPRLNAFTYWTYLFSGLFLYLAPVLGQAPHAGWFAYVPYTLTVDSPGLGMDIYALARLVDKASRPRDVEGVMTTSVILCMCAIACLCSCAVIDAEQSDGTKRPKFRILALTAALFAGPMMPFTRAIRDAIGRACISIFCASGYSKSLIIDQ